MNTAEFQTYLLLGDSLLSAWEHVAAKIAEGRKAGLDTAPEQAARLAQVQAIAARVGVAIPEA